MEKKKEKHHILISPELLFDWKNKYKVFYVPWIYVYLKLEKCIIFDKKIHLSSHQLKKHYKVNRKEIYNFYGFHKSTLSRALQWLNVMGLVEINGKEHKLMNDNSIFHYEKNDPEKDINKTDDDEEFFPSFVQIYYNFYFDFIELLKDKFDMSKSPGLLMRTVETFYYLITRNRHILLNIETLESEETESSISKYLHHDSGDIKKCLWCLNEIGYITTDIDGKIYTHYKYGKSKIKKSKTKAFRSGEHQLQQSAHLSPEWNTDLIYNEVEDIEVSDSSDDLSTEVATVKVNEEHIHVNEEQVNTKQEHKNESVTDKELIGHFETMSNGDNEKFKRLIKEHNISDTVVEEWRLNKNESSSDINKSEQLKEENKTEMDYQTAKQHLDYLFIKYQFDGKMFAKEVKRRKIPDDKFYIWIEEKAEEFALEVEE